MRTWKREIQSKIPMRSGNSWWIRVLQKINTFFARNCAAAHQTG